MQRMKFIRNKWFLGSLLLAGFAFVTCYCFLENPLLEENTASLIGVRHPFLFLIWNILTGAAFFFNIMAMYRTYRCPYRIGKGAAITYMVCIAASMGLLFFYARRQARRFNLLFVLVAATAAAMLTIFLTLGKSGLFEAVPVWMVYIILFLVNCTGLFTPPKKEKG